jgi:hypothetical protein
VLEHLDGSLEIVALTERIVRIERLGDPPAPVLRFLGE